MQAVSAPSTQVTFRSELFPATAEELEGMNSGVWGHGLASYLQENLPKYGLNPTCLNAEDWGWMVEIENQEFPLWIGCGHQDGDDDEFLCFIEPSKPVIKRLFKKIETHEQVARVSDALRQLLASNTEIHGVEWTAP